MLIPIFHFSFILSRQQILVRNLDQSNDRCQLIFLVLLHVKYLIAEAGQQQDFPLNGVEAPSIRQLKLRHWLVLAAGVDDKDGAASVLRAALLLCDGTIDSRAGEGRPVPDLVLLVMASDGMQPSVDDPFLVLLILVTVLVPLVRDALHEEPHEVADLLKLASVQHLVDLFADRFCSPGRHDLLELWLTAFLERVEQPPVFVVYIKFSQLGKDIINLDCGVTLHKMALQFNNRTVVVSNVRIFVRLLNDICRNHIAWLKL